MFITFLALLCNDTFPCNQQMETQTERIEKCVIVLTKDVVNFGTFLASSFLDEIRLNVAFPKKA